MSFANILSLSGLFLLSYCYFIIILLTEVQLLCSVMRRHFGVVEIITAIPKVSFSVLYFTFMSVMCLNSYERSVLTSLFFFGLNYHLWGGGEKNFVRCVCMGLF